MTCFASTMSVLAGNVAVPFCHCMQARPGTAGLAYLLILALLLRFLRRASSSSNDSYQRTHKYATRSSSNDSTARTRAYATNPSVSTTTASAQGLARMRRPFGAVHDACARAAAINCSSLSVKSLTSRTYCNKQDTGVRYTTVTSIHRLTMRVVTHRSKHALWDPAAACAGSGGAARFPRVSGSNPRFELTWHVLVNIRY